MFGFKTLGFIAALAIGGTGVDYTLQAKQEGLDLKEYGVERYIAVTEKRFDLLAPMLDSLMGNTASLQDFLPEAPAGWTREKWDDTAATLLADTDKEHGSHDFARAAALVAASRRKGEIWVYRRGDEVIALQAWYSRPRGQDTSEITKTKLIGSTTGSLANATHFARIAGIDYMVSKNEPKLWSERARFIAGRTDNHVRIVARARASNGSVRNLLGAINYGGLLAEGQKRTAKQDGASTFGVVDLMGDRPLKNRQFFDKAVGAKGDASPKEGYKVTERRGIGSECTITNNTQNCFMDTLTLE